MEFLIQITRLLGPLKDSIIWSRREHDGGFPFSSRELQDLVVRRRRAGRGNQGYHRQHFGILSDKYCGVLTFPPSYFFVVDRIDALLVPTTFSFTMLMLMMMQMLYRSTSLSLYKSLRAYPAGARSVLNITINAYLDTVNSTHTLLLAIVCITPSYLLQHKCPAVSINLRLIKILRTYEVDTSSVLDITCRPNTRLKRMNPIYT